MNVKALPDIDLELLRIKNGLNLYSNLEDIFFKTIKHEKSYKHIFSHAFSRRKELIKQLGTIKTSVAILNSSPLSLFINTLSLWELGHSVILLPGNISNDELTNLKQSLGFTQVIKDTTDYWTTTPSNESYNKYRLPNFKNHAITIMTSGTSGPSKGVMLSFENLFSSAVGTNHFYNINHNDCWVLPLPLHHIGGFMIVVRMLEAKGSILLTNHQELEITLQSRFANLISLVPTQLEKLLHIKRLSQFKGIILGGSKTPDHLLKRACSLKLPLANSFGLSEMTAQVTSTPICHDFELLKTGGKVLPYRDLDIIDNKIIYSGKTFFIGYQDIENKSFQSSDLGYFDSNQNFHFLGRSDHIFISGGENINPFELENKISSSFNLSDCIIVPVNHYKFGQVPFLFCNDTKDLKRDDFKLYLYPHEVPYQIEDITLYIDKTKIKPSRKLLRSIANKIFLDSSQIFSYETKGRPSGEVILFFHGFMGDKNDWNKIIDSLQKDYFCVSIDLPGHGHTKIESFLTTSDFFEKLKEFILSFETKVNIIAYSMGGRIISNLLVNHPELFNKVILESTGFGLINKADRKLRLDNDQKLFLGIGTQDQFQIFLHNWYDQNLFCTIKDHSDFNQMIESKSFQNINNFQQSLNLFGQAILPNIKNKLQLLPKDKILLICGALDKKYSCLAKSSKLNHIIMDHCSHNTHFQNKSDFSAIAKQFFSKKS